MKLRLFGFLFLCITIHMQGQIKDGQTATIAIPAEINEAAEKEPTPKPIPLKIDPSSKPSLTNPKSPNLSGLSGESSKSSGKKESEFSMIDNNPLMNPGQIFDQKWNSKAVEQGFKVPTMEDVFFGDYTIVGDHAHVMCRDHEYPDGDRVRVMVNDEVFIPNLLLTGDYKSFKVPLVEGINKIDFLALNQGESGPNTAEFKVYDDNDIMVSSKKWNLLTGVKATIIIIKE